MGPLQLIALQDLEIFAPDNMAPDNYLQKLSKPQIVPVQQPNHLQSSILSFKKNQGFSSSTKAVNREAWVPTPKVRKPS